MPIFIGTVGILQIHLSSDILLYTDNASKKCVVMWFFLFSKRCRKLPKGLKDWQAFLDLKKRIDDFSESCPLLEMMTNKAMKQRHWDRISELTGTPFDVESDSFCLRNIMEAPLLKHKDDIEVHKLIRSYHWFIKEHLLFFWKLCKWTFDLRVY